MNTTFPIVQCRMTLVVSLELVCSAGSYNQDVAKSLVGEGTVRKIAEIIAAIFPSVSCSPVSLYFLQNKEFVKFTLTTTMHA